MNATFSYNLTNGQPTSTQPFYPPTSAFQIYNHYPSTVLHNASVTIGQTAFTNVVSSTRPYQQPTHGIMQNHFDQYQNQDDDGESISESRTPTQSDQQVSGPMQNRKRRRGVIEKRRRDRINSSLAELRRLVPSALEKQGSQKLEKAEILQLTVDHLRFLNSKGLDTLWRDQQRYATEYYSMGFRVCISEVDTFLSKEGMDMNDQMRLRLMSHLQCVGVQRQSAFNVWTTNGHSNRLVNDQYQQGAYWSTTATTNPASSGFQLYGVLPASDPVYPSQPVSTTGQHPNGLPQPQVSYANGNFAPTSSTSASSIANTNGSGY